MRKLLALSLLVAAAAAAPETFATHDDTSARLYWADSTNSSIQRSYLDGSNVETVVTAATTPAGIALDVVNGNLYWTDSAAGSIRRADLDGAGAEDILSGLNEPWSLALDLGAGKIYWTDTTDNTVSRANLNGTNVEMVATLGADAPYDLGLDLQNGSMYLVTFSSEGESKLFRASLEGTNLTALTATFIPQAYTAVAVDGFGASVYLADVEACVPVPMCGGAAYGRVRVLDLDGAVQGTILSTTSTTSLAIDPVDGMIYWSDINTKAWAPPPAAAIHRAGTDGPGSEILVSSLDAAVDIAIGVNVLEDHDIDGCSSDRELGQDATAGGLRDPKIFWDFFDTPAPARDAQISGLDFFAVLSRFGANGDDTIDPLSAPPPAPAYHTAFDRGMMTGANAWNVAAADGSITGTDFFTMLSQFGHDCS